MTCYRALDQAGHGDAGEGVIVGGMVDYHNGETAFADIDIGGVPLPPPLLPHPPDLNVDHHESTTFNASQSRMVATDDAIASTFIPQLQPPDNANSKFSAIATINAASITASKTTTSPTSSNTRTRSLSCHPITTFCK